MHYINNIVIGFLCVFVLMQ